MNSRFLFQLFPGTLLTIFLTFSSCTHDTLMEIMDPDLMGCDSTNISFSSVIAPILEQNCYNGCHNGNSPTSGFLLDSYSGVKVKVDEERLYGAVAQLVGFVTMPLGEGRIPDCDISQIKAWIDEGALDN